MHEHLGVAGRREAVPAPLQVRAQHAMVVDLAVERRPDRAVLVTERLVSAVDVHHRQATGADADARRRIAVHALVVGAAMAQSRAHRPHRAAVGVLRAPCDPAHARNIDDRPPHQSPARRARAARRRPRVQARSSSAVQVPIKAANRSPIATTTASQPITRSKVPVQAARRSLFPAILLCVAFAFASMLPATASANRAGRASAASASNREQRQAERSARREARQAQREARESEREATRAARQAEREARRAARKRALERHRSTAPDRTGAERSQAGRQARSAGRRRRRACGRRARPAAASPSRPAPHF